MSRSLFKYYMKAFSMIGARFIFAALIIAPLCVKSQDIRPLSLQEAIDLSVKNSHILKASSAKIEQAASQVRQVMDNKLPNASVSGSYLYLANSTVTMKAARSGGSDTSGTKIPNINQAAYGILNVSLPVYAGGKIRYGIESAKYLQQAVQLDAENDKESVILNTINAYVNLYKASVTVDVVRENLAQSSHQDSVFSRLEQNGLLARNDLLKSELQTSNIELSLLDAENNLKITNVNMDLLLSLPETTVLKTDSTGFDKNYSLKTIDEYEQLALNNRKDVMALSFRKMAATKGISIAKADQYPTLVLTGGYIAADIPHFLTITNAANIGVGLKYDIASLWKSKAKIAESKSRVKEITANEAQLNDGVRLQVNRNFENFLLSQKKTEVYKKAVAQAEENYRITKNKYDNALVNTTDLLEADVSLLQSKINLAVSKADVLLAYSTLLETTGILSNNQ
ncbi:MAG: TolC family protein [Ginsengibacter sp.]